MYSGIRILVHQPVTRRLAEEFFLNRLLDERIDVSFYDLTLVYHPDLKVADEISSNEVIKFKRIKELEIRIKCDTSQNILYIPYFIYEYKVLNVYRLLTKYKCQMAFMGRGALPFTTLGKSYFEIALIKFSFLFNINFLISSIAKIYVNYLKKIGFVKKFDVIFNAGNNGHYTCGSSYEINYALKVPFNSTDYTRYLTSLNNKPYSKSGINYAVFIDEYLPYHPDVLMSGLKSVDPIIYYTSLNSFFEFVEKKFDVSIVVAAHPKSDYKINPYKDRLLIKGSTENLIKDSEFVIDHFSTAISYAVLNLKPLLLIYSNEIKNVYPDLVDYAKNVSNILDVNIINIDNIERNITFNVNVNLYNKYKYDYLTMEEAEGKLDQDIFVDFIKNHKSIL